MKARVESRWPYLKVATRVVHDHQRCWYEGLGKSREDCVQSPPRKTAGGAAHKCDRITRADNSANPKLARMHNLGRPPEAPRNDRACTMCKLECHQAHPAGKGVDEDSPLCAQLYALAKGEPNCAP